MSTGVLITLIICATILLIFVIALIGSNRSKLQDKQLRDLLRDPNTSNLEIERYIMNQTKDKK